MLPKTARLSRPAFAAAFKAGRRFHTSMATLIYVPGPTFHGSVVVSKKVSKKAVTRNQIRRQLYGQLVTHLKQKGCRGTVIVLVKPLAVQKTHATRIREIQQLIEQVRKPAYNSPHV